MRSIPRKLASPIAAAIGLAMSVTVPAAAKPASPGSAAAGLEYQKPTIVYDDLTLPDGRTAQVYSDGRAVILDLANGRVENRLLPAYDVMQQPTGTKLVVGRSQVLADLVDGMPTPYREGRVRVVLADGVQASEPVTSVPAGTANRLASMSGAALGKAAPRYTSSAALNQKLAHLGTARMVRIAASLPASTAPPPGGLDPTKAFVLDVTASQTASAVHQLLASPDVAYASPDWTVSPLRTQPFAVSQADLDRALAASKHASPATAGDGASLPTNYALSASMQSLLNRPGINWTEAYRILGDRYHQLPGEGQIITNVSVGYLTDANTPASDRCGHRLSAGPTSVVTDGQRYLDLPSMPLIPVYTAEADGTLSPTGTSCGADSLDGEIDLDFAVMAGLPHDKQRAGAIGGGYTDLLGVAPGADYRLVVPGGTTTDISAIDAALLAAARQTPRPDVITASLGFGFDTLGFPGRYLEEDPITQALVSTITHDYKVTVTIAAGDGLRQYTRAAWGPTGGSAALDVVGGGEAPTNLADLQMSTAPSRVADSGAIAVGGTTLDDIFSAPPQDPANAALAAQHAFPITRFNGMRNFSSGFGSRVDVSAPGDNILAFQHFSGGQANQVTPVITGGTSASAPIVAATAAVVKQTAELTGDEGLAADPLRIRSWLKQTGTPVPDAAQADQPLHVGPQVDVGAAVSRLVSDRSGYVPPAAVARVAVEQRRPYDGSGGIFLADTNAANISLSGDGQVSWITIAPDWIGEVAGDHTSYALTVGGATLARTAHARLLPKQIFAAAGKQFPSTERTSITLTYTARHRGTRVSTDVELTFTPVSGSMVPLAPLVPTVVTGDMIPVSYDVSMFSNIDHPVLIVTGPGRISTWDTGWHIFYQKVLNDFAGTVQVPVAALQGGGVYGVAIQGGLLGPNAAAFTHFAAVRIPGARSNTRPSAPTLSRAGEESGQHTLSVGYTDRVTVGWDVRNVPHVTGARLEVSPPGPTHDAGSAYNTVNNPNGTIRDDNKLDTGSVVDLALPGTHGQITLTGNELGLVPGGYQQVRVRPIGKDGTGTGEASDVSTIHQSGISGPEGQRLWSFGVDQHGDNGVMVTSTGTFGTGQAAVTRFDQATGEPTDVLWSTTTERLSAVGTSGPLMFAGHTALIEAMNNASRQLSFTAINVGTGERHSWDPPEGYLPPGTDTTTWNLSAANEQDTPNSAFIAYRFGGGWRVFSSNVAAGTFGPLVDLSPSLSTLSLPYFLGMAQDPTTNTAYVYVTDIGNDSRDYLIAANLADGSQRTIDLGVTNPLTSDGIAVDPASHTAIVAGGSTVHLVDLNTDEVRTTTVSGGTGRNQWITIDRTRGLYLDFDEVGIGTLQPNRYSPGNAWSLAPDANRVSNVAVLDTEGHVDAILPSFLEPNFIRTGGANMQVDPSTGTGYVRGSDGVSLAPFHYGD